MPSNDRLLQMVRERTPYERLYRELCAPNNLIGNGPWRKTRCCFHEDSDPSLSVNIEEGQYKCFVPNCDAHGDFIGFYMRRRSLTFPQALNELADICHITQEERGARAPERDPIELAARNERALQGYRPPEAAREEPELAVDVDVVEAFHARLLRQEAQMAWLADKRGLTAETVQRFKLGHDGHRYTIPIVGQRGDYVNVRRYKPGASASDKMLSWSHGFGQARLYPLTFREVEGTVFIFEGEMDTLLAQQHGLNAVTTTGGAGTWRDNWNRDFEGRDVVICYDVDEAGKRGAAHVAQRLRGVASRVRVLRLPLAEPVGADFTNYIVDHGHSLGDFTALVELAADFDSNDATTPVPQEPQDVHLSKASEAQYYNQPVRLTVMVSGKMHAPYLLPKDVRMDCGGQMGMHSFCERCRVNSHGGPLTVALQYDTNEILQFVGAPDDTLQRKLKIKAGVPAKCPYVKPDTVNAINVEEIQIIPEIDRSEEDAPYVTRTAYYIGHGTTPNRSYIMTGVTTPEPSKQFATHLIHTAEPAQSNIDRFQLGPDTVAQLNQFSVADTGGLSSPLWAKLQEIYNELEKVTRIYERRDIMLAVDLTFHSALSFNLQGDPLVRGWVETLIIGDSRTGKTTIVDRMMRHYGAGEFVSGENTSYAGLIGGLHQIGTTWNTSWGKIPLNDRRLIAIDEASNMPIEQIGRMSAMRSSGIAEITKIHTEKTSARTRQIWISNPRSPRPLSSFGQGVLAVKELIGAPEDIARFDIVAAVASGDVGLVVVNAPREVEAPEIYTSALCHQRTMWAWSRARRHVRFAPGATAHTLLKATEQGRKYRFATEIPLVEPNEQRVKLARLAVATAALFFSTDPTGEMVEVRREHVQFAFEYLEKLYCKRALSFAEYAEAAMRKYQLVDPERNIPRLLRRNAGAVGLMMEQEHLTQRDLREILAMDEANELRVAVTQLRDAGFLRRMGTSYYMKTPAAIEWLRREIEGANLVEEEQERLARNVSEIADLITAPPSAGQEPEW